MLEFAKMSSDELKQEYAQLQKVYGEAKAKKLKLDMTRGKPSPEQLDLSNALLTMSDFKADNIDCRNYGNLGGIPSCKKLFADFLEVGIDEVFIGGSSSLNMMYDAIARAMLFGTCDGQLPWSKLPKIKFLAPVPGYDRHFAICELFGIEMIPVEMDENGPDMDTVEALVKADSSIKGIWCTPKYSNPGGVVYSNEVISRFAKMETAAPDFRIFWDNAYTVHHLTDKRPQQLNILEACKAAGCPHRVYIFGSTAKVTFAGAGIAMMGADKENINFAMKQIGIQTICADKVNQLRHVNFLKDMDGVAAQMTKHAAILKPKFDKVLEVLERDLGGLGVGDWSKPEGGYFISFNALDGCAKRIVSLAAEAGVALTNAGATYPYGKDPRDRNIRIAPSFPSVDELEQATELFALCTKIASIEKLLA